MLGVCVHSAWVEVLCVCIVGGWKYSVNLLISFSFVCVCVCVCVAVYVDTSHVS